MICFTSFCLFSAPVVRNWNFCFFEQIRVDALRLLYGNVSAIYWPPPTYSAYTYPSPNLFGLDLPPKKNNNNICLSIVHLFARSIERTCVRWATWGKAFYRQTGAGSAACLQLSVAPSAHSSGEAVLLHHAVGASRGFWLLEGAAGALGWSNIPDGSIWTH